MFTNRVVVTGYGVTPHHLEIHPEEFWNSLHEGKIGIKPITKFDASEIPAFNAGEIQDSHSDKYFVKRSKSYGYLLIVCDLCDGSMSTRLEYGRRRPRSCRCDCLHLVSVFARIKDQIIRMHERGMKRIQPMFGSKSFFKHGCWKYRT